MAVIPMPASPAPQTEEWTLTQPSEANRSEFTGRRRVTILPEAPRWSTKVTLPSILGEAAVRPWRSFLARLQGRVNAFKLVAVEAPQFVSPGQVVVNGAGQTGFTLATRGWTADAYIGDGYFVTVGDQLLQVVGRTIASGGLATLSIMPQLRAPTVDGAAVEVRLPYALVSLAEDKAGWTTKPGPEYSIEIAVEEAF